ncbi:MAG: hypothetical protein ACJ77N_14005 [Chloroflexota bacterium]
MSRTRPNIPRRKQNAPRVEPTSRQAEADPVAAARDAAAWRLIHPF